MSTRHIFAVDPGKATGACFFEWEDGKDPVMLYSWELKFETFAPIVRWALENYPNTEVVCERFVITAQTAKNSQAPYSLEHIGVLKQCVFDVGRDYEKIAYQTPTDAKNMFPNPQLKKVGYWHTGGAGHALDSIRHACLYMVNNGWSAKKLLS